MNSDHSSRKNGRTKSWGRYRNLMLVGDQGEVIPFRRFKLLASGLIVALVVSLVSVAVLGVLLAIYQTRVSTQKVALKEAQNQLVKLRDEKDLLLTQIVINKNKNGTAPSEKKVAQTTPETPVAPAEVLQKDKVIQAKKRPVAEAVSPKPSPPPPPPPKPVEPGADLRRIKVSYQPDRQLLNLSFRIYNASKPKKPLAGRTVVVFKNQDDPPIQWLSVPRVQLTDGKPSGKRGKAFKINNYRTESFKAFRQKAPVRFNLATIFVYTSGGDLLLTKDYSFKITAPPPPKPVIPAPKPAQEKRDKPVAPVAPVPKTIPPPSVPAPLPKPTLSPSVPAPDPPPSGSNVDTRSPVNSVPAASDPTGEVQIPEIPPRVEPPDTDSQINQEVNPDSQRLDIDIEQSTPTPIQNQSTTQGEQR